MQSIYLQKIMVSFEIEALYADVCGEFVLQVGSKMGR
jgi:hypothetical protein